MIINGGALLKKIVLVITALILTFILLFFVALMIGKNAEGINRAGQFLGEIKIYLAVIRLGLISLVWYFWEPIINKLYPETLANHQKVREHAYSRRNQITAIFVFIEIFIAQNAFVYLFGGLV